MNLDNNIISYVENVIQTAQLIGIDDVILETGVVRAATEDKSVFIFQDQDVPVLPFSSIGLSRLDVLTSRLKTAAVRDNFSVDLTMNDDQTFVKALIIKGKGIKIDYRCGDPRRIKAPLRRKSVMLTQIEISPDAISLMQQGQASMRSDLIQLISDERGVTFELTDISSDVFSHTFTTVTKSLVANADQRFAWCYPVKLLLTLLKNNSNSYFCVGEKGMLNVTVNNLNIFLMAQV